MAAAAEILLVEDERVVRRAFRALFEGEGFAVREAKDGEEGVRAFAARRPDLVVLDVMMPRMGGLPACEAIRARDPHVPILFLTGVPSETTQLRAYGVGADDYVEKDTNPDLIVAKVRAALRRGALPAPGAREEASGPFRLGRVSVDRRLLEVSAAGKPIGRLTKSEWDILQVLSARGGQTVSTDAIIAALRGAGFACEDTMVYVHVSNLRRKLGPESARLTNVRGAGYALRID